MDGDYIHTFFVDNLVYHKKTNFNSHGISVQGQSGRWFRSNGCILLERIVTMDSYSVQKPLCDMYVLLIHAERHFNQCYIFFA